MALFPVTLSDPNYTKPPFCIAFHIFIVGRDKYFKFGKRVDRSKCQSMDEITSPKGAWSRDLNYLNFGGHQPYLWNSWSSCQILYTGRLCQVPLAEWEITLEGAWSGSRDTFYILGIPEIPTGNVKDGGLSDR